MANYLHTYIDKATQKKKVFGSQFLGFNNEIGTTTSNQSLTALEQETGLEVGSHWALTFEGFTPSSTFSQATFDTKIGNIIRSGRGVVFNFEPLRNTALATGSFAQINSGSHDALMLQLNTYLEALAKDVPDLKDRFVIKFMHEANLSAGAYDWTILNPLNLGSTHDRFTTTEAQVQASINAFKTAFERLANLFDRRFGKIGFEMGQDNYQGNFTCLADFFPSLNSFDIAFVNSYNRSQIASGYGYSGTIKENLKSWLETVNEICPNKLKGIGESSSTSLATLTGFGSPLTITNGGTGFPASSTFAIPATKIWGNGDVNPSIEVTTNASGVIISSTITGNGLGKGEDLTDCVIGDASSGGTTSFNGGTGFIATVNFRQWYENKAKWFKDCGEFLSENDFDYYFSFLETKTGGANDYRDWNLTSDRQKRAYNTLINSFLGNSSIYDYQNNSGQIGINLCRDRWTTNLNQWKSAGANAGTVDLTTNTFNRPYYTPVNSFTSQSMVRLTHSITSGAYTSGNTRPYDNRLRYFIPIWDGQSQFRRGYRPNDTITIKFKAMFKVGRRSGTANLTNWKAPLLVAIEQNNGQNNYERGQAPQIFLTKQMQEYTVQTSFGSLNNDGYYLNFMIGNANISGEFIMTDVRVTVGADDNAQVIDDLVVNEMRLLGTTTLNAMSVGQVSTIVTMPILASTAVLNPNTGVNFVNGAYTLAESQNGSKLHIEKVVIRPETITGIVTTPPAFSVGSNIGINDDFAPATTMTGATTLNTEFEIFKQGAKKVYLGGENIQIRCTTAQIGATNLVYRAEVYGRYLPN